MASPRIDFYVLQEQSSGGRFKLACRIIEKAYRLGHTIYVKTNNLEDATMLDDLLWTFSQSSFVPHKLSDDIDSLGSPVVIGQSPLVGDNPEVAVSVADIPISNFITYPRIAEIVGYEPEQKALARNRFRYYREHGVEPKTHRIAM